MPKRKTTEEFRKQFHEIFPNSPYDLSKFIYEKWDIHSIAICPKHGCFSITPNNLLCGYGCKQCGIERSSQKRTKSTDVFKEEYFAKFPNSPYDLSKFIYKGYEIKSDVICPQHGIFYRTPDELMRGCGCDKCRRERQKTLFAKRKEEFEKEYFAKFPNSTYDLSEYVYENNKTKGNVICQTHGIFPMSPIHLLRGQGCPFCKCSYMENEVRDLLIERKINFEEQKKFGWLGLQSLDFYVPQYNIAIECQGIQHFESVQFFGGDKKLQENIVRDKTKLDLCNSNGIKLLYYANYEYDFPYKVITDKSELLKQIKPHQYD